MCAGPQPHTWVQTPSALWPRSVVGGRIRAFLSIGRRPHPRGFGPVTPRAHSSPPGKCPHLMLHIRLGSEQ